MASEGAPDIVIMLSCALKKCKTNKSIRFKDIRL